MTWSQKAWEVITPLYHSIIEMPFNAELLSGTLDQSQFKFYMAQDAYYLGDFAKALSTISSKLTKAEHVLAYSNFASGAIVVERALHENYFRTLGIPDHVKPSPTCLLYTNFLLTQAAYANVEVAAAAVLPCFWIYKKVGDHIYKSQTDRESNPYKDWIDTYSGEDFAESVASAIAITDELAEQVSLSKQQEMLDAFVTASKLEWMFWDSAYRMEKWPVGGSEF